MKVKNLLICTLFFCCTLGLQPLNAQLVEKASITANEANFKMISPNSYLMEIAGPNDYYFRQEIEFTKKISLSNVDMKGKKFPDGTYKMQVTPLLNLSETTRQELATLRTENDQEKIAAYRLENELPAEVNVYNISFSIQNGEFVSPSQKEIKEVNMSKMSGLLWKQDLLLEQDHPVLYASLNNVDIEYGKPVWTSNALPLAKDNTPMIEDDQQFLDDVIVVGSICVGQDCNNGESFGFDTGRYKENNLRVHFDDTSNSASFPSNDWRITINDSSNGGASYFAVEDATAGNIPFRIEAGAGANALYVDDGGRIGIGTSTPVVDIHNKTGNTPTLRLDQDGSSGFTSQIWDVAGNEANFFVRDVTNGSKLPFKIKPNSPTSSIFIEGSTGDVGLGTESPDAELDIENSSNPAVRLTNSSSNTWEVISADNSGRLNFTNVTNGNTPLKMDDLASNNLLKLGVDGFPDYIEMTGTLDLTGTLLINGIDNSNPDYVFEPEYNLESIEEHAAYMWKNKHLPAVGSGVNGKDGKAMINVANRSQGVLEELEKAHLYIEQLHKRINNEKESRLEVNNEQQKTIDQQAVEIADLKAQLTKMETLETQLAELTQMVSALNKTTNSSDKANGEKE